MGLDLGRLMLKSRAKAQGSPLKKVLYELSVEVSKLGGPI